jgi:Na+/H+-dicarboxylate symporter
MKIWIKYLLAIIAGAAAALLLPENILLILKPLLPAFREVIIRIGTYLLYPLLFFSLSYAVYKLRIEKRIFIVFSRSFLIIAASGFLLTLIGTGSVLLFSPSRIPVIIESGSASSFPNVLEMFRAVFPPNLFSLFDGEKAYLFPYIILAILLGSGFSFDKVLSRPAVQLFDSLSRIFFHLSRFFVEILAFAMIFLSAAYAVHITETPEFSLFLQLFLLLTIDTIIIIFGIYPLLIFFLTGEKNPYRLLYGLTAPALTAFLSGNSQFTYISLANHVHANLGVSRPVGASVLPLFSLFGKAGTAMVTSVGFIVLLSSYSSLGIGAGDIIWIIFAAFGTSFLTGTHPYSGVLTAIAVMCAAYGKGIEEAYLIFLPALPLLMSFSTLLDTVTAGLGSFAAGRRETGNKEVHAKDFI